MSIMSVIDKKNKIIEEAKGCPLPSLFSSFQFYFGSIYQDDSIKEMFLSFMLELVVNGELKLADYGVLLSGTPEEQIDMFRKSWPESYDENDPDKDIDVSWWYLKAPAGAVWIYPDGYEEWT